VRIWIATRLLKVPKLTILMTGSRHTMALEAISNPEAISTLYDDPSVMDNAFLHAIELSPNDPKVKLVVMIPSAPSRTPGRWRKTDKTLIEMQVLDITSFRISAWQPERPTPIKIARGEDGLISLKAEDDSLHIICGWIYVDRIRPY
jgi:hypothetical protein